MEAVFLGIIALATVVMAVIQVGAAVEGARLMRQLEQAATQFQRDVQPIIARAAIVSEEAARMASMVSAQVERADVMLTDLGRRVDDTVTLVQTAVVTPAREGLALLAGVRAAITALRGRRGGAGHGTRHEDEEALFIG
jgi:hypothetical protein